MYHGWWQDHGTPSLPLKVIRPEKEPGHVYLISCVHVSMGWRGEVPFPWWTWRRSRTSGARIPCRNVVKKPFHQCVPDSACRQAKLLRNDTNILNLQRLELRPKTLCATALHDTAQPCNRFLHFDLRTNPACELFLQANPLHGHAQLRS